MIPILIMAAGQSTRMRGADKMLEDANGEPLLRRQVKMAAATGAPVFVALPTDASARQIAIADLDVAVLTVPEAIKGLSHSLRGALQQLPGCDAFMVMLADLVALETEDLLDLINARRDQPDAMIWRATTQAGQPGHPVIFDARLRPTFETLNGDDGAAPIIAQNATQTVLVPLKGNRARFDLDTPEDWAAWRAISH